LLSFAWRPFEAEPAGQTLLAPMPEGDVVLMTGQASQLSSTGAVEEVGLEMDAYSLFLVRLLEIWDTNSTDVEIIEAGKAVEASGDGVSHGSTLIKTQKEKSWTFTLLNFSHAFVLYVLAVALQLCVTMILLQNAERLESSWESHAFHQKYNVTMVEAAGLLDQAVDTNHPQLNCPNAVHGALVKRCTEQLQVRYYFFYYIMIFIWIATMLSEFDNAFSLVKDLWHVDTSVVGDKNLSNFGHIVENGKPRRRIVNMTSCQKVVLIFLVPVIRIGVAMAITYSGCKFLMLQVSEMRIVLKALCMKFVITIDDLFLVGFSTKAARDRLKALKLKTRRLDVLQKGFWYNAGGGFFHMAVAFAGLSAVWFIFQDLMLFRKSCAAYHVQFGEFKDLGTQRRLSFAEDL